MAPSTLCYIVIALYLVNHLALQSGTLALRFSFLSPGSVVCFDAKINFDDSAKFRQREIFAMEDTAESDPREVEAARYDLNYIGMTGDIGCLGIYTFQVVKQVTQHPLSLSLSLSLCLQ